MSGPSLSRYTGIVSSFVDPPGYGFIKYQDASGESKIFLTGGEAMQAGVVVGDYCTFSIEESAKGSRARRVEKKNAAEGDARSPDAAGIPQLLQDFRLRYPHDDRANERLVKSEESVQRAVLVEFRSRSEGEGDYSALLMTAVLRIQDRLGKAHYSSVPCKYGRKCKRSDCWFQTQDHLVVVPRVLNPNVLVTSATCQLLRRRAQR